MKKLADILREIYNENDFINLKNDLLGEMLYEQYAVLGELLDPNNSYEYDKIGRNKWEYYDSMLNHYFVSITYQPLDIPYFELKTGWYRDDRPQYSELPDNVSSMDWDKRSNTVAKIYRDEIIPFFLTQDKLDVLKIKPIDIKRYQFSIRMVKKLTPHNIQIQENKPLEIILTK